MGVRFNPPPGWPHPPQGWRPAPNWAPDPSWPPAPASWEYWVRDDFDAIGQIPAQHRVSLGTTVAEQLPQPVVAATLGTPPSLVAAAPTGPVDSSPPRLGSSVPQDPEVRLVPHQGGPPTPPLAAPLPVEEVAAGDHTSRPRWLLPAVLVAALGATASVGVFFLRSQQSQQTGTLPSPSAASPATVPSAATAVTIVPTRPVVPATPPTSAVRTGPVVPPGPVTGNASTLLGTLVTQANPSAIPYSRNAFGSGWIDADANGCDTGSDVILRDLTDVRLKSGSPCVPVAGTLLDPYVGRTEQYPSVAGKVGVDFVVPLADAWNNGASGWTPALRNRFVNDTSNLVTLRSSTILKRDGRSADAWLPSRVGFRCEYIARQIGIKRAYGLSVTPGERATMTKILSSCPDQAVPQGIVSPGIGGATAVGEVPPSAVTPGAPAAPGAVVTPPSVSDPVQPTSTPQAVTRTNAPILPRQTSSAAPQN